MQANHSMGDALRSSDSQQDGLAAASVGVVSTKRNRQAILKQTIESGFVFFEYSSYLFTLYMLMALNVLPEYPAISRYSLAEWASELPLFSYYLLYAGMMLVIHAFILAQGYLFSGKAQRSFIENYWHAARAVVLSFLITVGMMFLLKTSTYYSRKTLVALVVLMLIEALGWRMLRESVIRGLNRKGYLRNRVLIVGAGKVGYGIAKQMRQGRGSDQFVGYLDDYKQGADIVGRTDELEAILQRDRIDIVYITIPSERPIIESMLHTVYKYDVDIRIIPEMYDRMSTVFTFRNDPDLPSMQIVKTPLRGMNIVLKRIIDLIASGVLLIALSPAFLAIGVIIKADSPGPVFFRQRRVGKSGIPFEMLKFRSMSEGADRMKDNLLKANELSGPVFKLREDPRVTKIGRWLRKFSMDELPQLWNVFKGQMSLIGPRPPLPAEVAAYSNYHWRRMDVLPGMTGLWQVSGRSDLDFERWIDLDIYYIERWSLALELKIVLKTIPVVIKGTGAY